jgi:hypothetical protein
LNNLDFRKPITIIKINKYSPITEFPNQSSNNRIRKSGIKYLPRLNKAVKPGKYWTSLKPILPAIRIKKKEIRRIKYRAEKVNK